MTVPSGTLKRAGVAVALGVTSAWLFMQVDWDGADVFKGR